MAIAIQEIQFNLTSSIPHLFPSRLFLETQRLTPKQATVAKKKEETLNRTSQSISTTCNSSVSGSSVLVEVG